VGTKSATLSTDQNYQGISAPVLFNTIQSGASYTPSSDVSVIIGEDVVVTVSGGVGLPILQGMALMFAGGVTYEFSQDIPIGISEIPT